MSFCMSRLIATPLISAPQSFTSTSSAVSQTSHASFSKNKNLTASCGVYGFSSSRRLRKDPMLMIARWNFVVRSNITPPPPPPPPPGAPLPSGSPSGSTKNWVLGIVLTFVLPFVTHKWGPLILLKNKVETMVDMAEHIAETIEDVAGRVDKVIDKITEDLPENSQLRKTLEAVDAFVEEVEKTARFADDIIDKVEEAGDKLESLILSDAKEEKVSKQVAEKVEVTTVEPSALKIK